MKDFTPTDIRRLFAGIMFIDRDELCVALGRHVLDHEWRGFPENFRTIFTRASDAQREKLAGLINRNLIPYAEREVEHA